MNQRTRGKGSMLRLRNGKSGGSRQGVNQRGKALIDADSEGSNEDAKQHRWPRGGTGNPDPDCRQPAGRGARII